MTAEVDEILAWEELPDLISPTELRQFTRCGKRQVYEWIHDKDIGIRIGRSIRVPKQSLRHLIRRESGIDLQNPIEAPSCLRGEVKDAE